MTSTTNKRAVLFLCTGNSARSILAEAILNSRGGDRFRAFSAGSRPTGRVNPAAVAELEARHHNTSGLRSKSWDEFSGAGAPEIDLVFTVCDNAAGESCPVWAGSPVTVHWGIPDPAAAPAAGIRGAFRDAYASLSRKIDGLLALPLDSMDEREIRAALTALANAES